MENSQLESSDEALIWYQHSGLTVDHDSNESDIINISEPICRQILYAKVGSSSVNVWDLMILVPNVIFLLFLMIKMPRVCLKLRKNDSPMFSVCLLLVCLANAISVIRCIVSMCIYVPMSTTDRAIWLLLKFFLLATELSVIVFGFMFGHLESRRSIRRVLFVTFAIALAYSFTQGALEFLSHNETFHNITIKPGSTYYLFGHGGMMFWFISSVVLSLLYVTVCILPLTQFPQRFAAPTRYSFYLYCALLAVLNTAQAVGCGLLYFFNIPSGWCIIDVTSYLYFAGFPPLLYMTFLRSFFAFVRQPKLSFSYQTHVDQEPGGVEDPDYTSSQSQPPIHTSINTDDDELILDEEGASGMEAGAATSPSSLLHGWRHLHAAFVGVPEVKNCPVRRTVSRSSPSSLLLGDDRQLDQRDGM